MAYDTSEASYAVSVAWGSNMRHFDHKPRAPPRVPVGVHFDPRPRARHRVPLCVISVKKLFEPLMHSRVPDCRGIVFDGFEPIARDFGAIEITNPHGDKVELFKSCP